MVGEPVWLEPEVALAIHDRQLAEHGGLQGLRDPDALQAALERPRHKWAYGETDPANLAAAYAWGLARSHPFADGNKRTAWVLARLFLVLNGFRLDHGAEETIRIVLALAGGELEEEAFAAWLRNRLSPSPADSRPAGLL
ncbi:MAG: type II toxin-antitoxin system death-on-curing family toxin [Phenylobacterium sp.]|nr:type II toxin-antitoxin system death-on-curing family toxin [Phenylobacterium sp.]MCA6289157.1 type II toxin-antitoxin system death-on-curing family toxin [Phenylobacterium sp.]MCA6309101.1 type II toxin-antitoxin system death-on-curing family toxin [Phenylobacterium sp.]MCA6323986.1 type II toxin-antitoxin system death-on-curing family toxin [Phenylobacterium sp.]MCA6338279.1 type II toxin-antitoxin system death-on-curing family toxin [Phenylobacterium sp.]